MPNSLSYLISLDYMTFLLFFISALFPHFIEASALPSLSMDKTLSRSACRVRDLVLILLSQVHQFF